MRYFPDIDFSIGNIFWIFHISIMRHAQDININIGNIFWHVSIPITRDISHDIDNRYRYHAIYRMISIRTILHVTRLRYFFWAGPVDTSQASHKFPPEHRLLLLLAGPFQLCFCTFFLYFGFLSFFLLFISSFLLFRLCLYVKPTANYN